MSYTIIIPARYASQRLPGKALADIGGKPMIQHVYERALQTRAAEVLVATDDERIAAACRDFNAEVCMTSAAHPSGTDRLQEVVQQRGIKDEQIIINVQGDEPMIPAAVIEQVAQNLQQHPQMAMATLCELIEDEQQIHDPNIVKVVFNQQGRALYFSRAAIPFMRDADTQRAATYRHLGLYAYRAGFLNAFVNWPQAEIECTEKLEQLRALQQGADIHVAVACENIPPGIDTEQDLAQVRALFAAQAD